MGLTVDDLNAVRAQWEEWTADSGFGLRMEVRAGPSVAVPIDVDRGVGARVISELYCQVEIWRENLHGTADPLCEVDSLVFSERVPYDAAALRASVSVLARTIAEHQERLAARDDG